MFLMKKILTCCLLPPGCLIILLLVGVIFCRKRLRLFVVCLAALTYVIAIEPTKDLLLMPLENAFPVPSPEQIKKADAYVYLGGGLLDRAPDLSGKGMLGGEAVPRLLTTFRLYRMAK